MVAALERVAGKDVAARIGWERDPAIERIVGSWPGAWDSARARALGFTGDTSRMSSRGGRLREVMRRA